jgi:hypothetical protein
VLKNSKEEIIFKEAHRSISNLYYMIKTYKCDPEIHFINLLNNLGIKGSSFASSQTSNTSTNSDKYITL